MPFLERVLTPKRLEHSLGVMQVMRELAEVYALDLEASLAAGLLHDAAKDLTPSHQLELIAEGNIEIHDASEWDYVLYLHGPVGAYFVYRELGVTDPLILDAIKMHTYYGHGANLNAPIVWCLRFSDLLEPNRDWQNVSWLSKGIGRLREAVYAGRMQEAAFLQTGWLIQWFEADGKPVHPNMRRVYQELSTRLGLDSSFLEQA